jgi:hypothetical protein
MTYHISNFLYNKIINPKKTEADMKLTLLRSGRRS